MTSNGFSLPSAWHVPPISLFISRNLGSFFIVTIQLLETLGKKLREFNERRGVSIGVLHYATTPYLSELFLGDFLFRVARSNFAEAGESHY